MDLTQTIEPKSDQINADDLVTAPRTFTIKDVKAGNSEQPVNIYLAETDRAYRPSKTCRRVIVAAWGEQSSGYIGKRLTLCHDPSIKFGGIAVGGIRISHMSDLPNGERMSLMLTFTRSKRAAYIVDPLPNVATPDPRIAALRAEWETADPERRAAIEAEVKALNTTNEEK